MRQMRARAFAIRDIFPDVLKGIAIAEEVQDIQETPSTPAPIAPPTAPQVSPPVQLQPTRHKVVGNKILQHFQGDTKAFAGFIVQTLGWDESIKLEDKWFETLNEEELNRLEAALEGQMVNEEEIPV